MSAQTSYEINQPVAYAGLVYAQSPHDIVSGLVETVAGIAFGTAVGRGTADDQIVAGTANFVGVAIRSLDQEGAINTGAIQWDETEAAGVLRSGYIWATCPTGCVPGDLVNYVTATGVLDSGAATAGETGLDDARWETTTAAGELGVIRINSTLTTAGS